MNRIHTDYVGDDHQSDSTQKGHEIMVDSIREERYATPSRLGVKIASREADGTVRETEANMDVMEAIMLAAHGLDTGDVHVLAGCRVDETYYDLNEYGQVDAVMFAYADLLDSVASLVHQGDENIDTAYGRLVDTYRFLLDDYAYACPVTAMRLRTIEHANVLMEHTPQIECAHRTWTCWRDFTRHAIHG